MNNVDRITERLVATGKWGARAVKIAAKSNFRCAYCDRDMLASVNDYKSWQEDHIVPINAGGKDEEENIALSCRTCNVNVKSKWNPMERCSENPSREELIQVCRDYVSERRTAFLKDVAQFREIVFGEST